MRERSIASFSSPFALRPRDRDRPERSEDCLPRRSATEAGGGELPGLRGDALNREHSSR